MEYDITYCGERCEIGKAAKERFLDNCESVFDAVFDFYNFTGSCIKACPYRDENKPAKE